MTILATCLTLAALLSGAKGGETVTIRDQDCAPMTLAAAPAKQVTVNAGATTFRSLRVTGANLRIRSARFVAVGGMTAGPPGYALTLQGARNVRLDGIRVGLSRKGIVIDSAANVTIADSRFDGVGEDGVIVARTAGLVIARNVFTGTIGKPTECALAGGVVPGLPSRDCLAQGGRWADGYHPDAVQMRNAVTDALLTGNRVEGRTQGLTQMDTTGDAPLERVRIVGNTLRTAAYHPITLYACRDCLIEGNDVRRAEGSPLKAVINAGEARACGNVAPDMKPGSPALLRCPSEPPS